MFNRLKDGKKTFNLILGKGWGPGGGGGGR